MRSAVIVAGGYSTRFGDRDKATARLDGRPVIRRVAEALAPVVEELVVDCRREQRDRLAAALSGLSGPDPRFAVDPVPDRGPVAGVRTGCRAADGEWTFVAACDLPFLDSAVAGELFDAATAEGRAGDRPPAIAGTTAGDATGDGAIVDAAVPVADGRPRPLAAVYRTDAAVDAADAVLDRGSGAVRDLLGELSVATVAGLDPAAFADVDTREDLREAASQFGTRTRTGVDDARPTASSVGR